MSDTPQPPMSQPSAEEPRSAEPPVVSAKRTPTAVQTAEISAAASRQIAAESAGEQQISTLSDTAVKAAVSASLPFEASMQQQQMQWNTDHFPSDQAKLRALHGASYHMPTGASPATPGTGSFQTSFSTTNMYYGGAASGSQQVFYGGQASSPYSYHQAYSQGSVVLPQVSSASSVVIQGPAQYQSSGIRQISGVGSSTTTTRVDISNQRVIGERVIEHEVKVPKKVVREDVIEKVIVIPEKIVHEEVIEDVQMIREKIIEVAVPVIQERIVEVPEIEYVEKIVEIPEIIYQEKVREVPRIEIQERIVEIPRIIHQEKIVEIPEIEYRDIPVEKIVEVPEIREQIVVKEIPVPQYIDKPMPQYVDVHQEQEISRAIPIPVEAVTTCEFKLPRIRPRYTKVDVPLYVPRFVEVPIPLDVMDSQAAAQAENYAQQVAALAAQSAVSMCEVENLAGSIKATNFEHVIAQQNHSEAVAMHWMSGRLQVDPMSMAYAASTSTPPVLDSLASQTTANQQQTTANQQQTTTTTTTTTRRVTTGHQGGAVHREMAATATLGGAVHREMAAVGGAVVLCPELPVLPAVDPVIHVEAVAHESGASSRHVDTVATTSMVANTSGSSALAAEQQNEMKFAAAESTSFMANQSATTTTDVHREAQSSVEVEVEVTKTTTIINPDGTEATETVTTTERHQEPVSVVQQ